MDEPKPNNLKGNKKTTLNNKKKITMKNTREEREGGRQTPSQTSVDVT